MLFSFVFLTLIFSVFGKPIRQFKRYDLDCNGTPDLCVVEGGTARCLLSGGAYTTFPASSTIICPTATATAQSQTGSIFNAVVATPIPTHTGLERSISGLPSPAQFAADKGTRWKIELQGNLAFEGPMGNQNVMGDKGRTGKIGGKVVWNFGDMMCNDDYKVCGFGYGPAFYGTDSVMKVDCSGTQLMQNNDFVQPWSGDKAPALPQNAWGMDTTNVAPINDTHGVVFAWQIWRGAADKSYVDRGNAAAMVTLEADKPVAKRVGPLLTGSDTIQLGLLAILRDGNYIYTYSIGGASNVIVGRVPADDSVFDTSKHEFLQHGTDVWKTGIPSNADKSVGATTANPSGQFGCAVYGSVYFNTYLQKYVMLCSIYMSHVNMYTSATPYGPWSEEYSITTSGQDGLLAGSYGAHAHPSYGDGKEWYFSIGPNTVFQMFKITFNY